MSTTLVSTLRRPRVTSRTSRTEPAAVGRTPQHDRPYEGYDHGDERAHCRPQEDVAPDQGILPPPAQKTGPGHQHVRPVPPDVGLEGEVEDPHHRRHQDAHPEARMIKVSSPRSRPRGGPRGASRRALRQRERGEAARPRAIAASQAQVVPGEQERGGGHDDDDGEADAAGGDLARPCARRSMRSGRVHSHTIWKKTGLPR